MTWKKKGNRIRASDKSLVYHFCIGWLLLLFVAVFLLLNLRQLLVIDWKDFNLLHAGITWTAYNSITVLIATGVCALVAFLYYRYGQWDDYESEYTTFDVCGTEIRVLDEELAEALKQLPEQSRNIVLMFFFLDMSDWQSVQQQVLPDCPLVLSYNGTPTSKTTLPRALEKLSNLAGVHRIKIHALRHSHASLLISMGENPLLIKERLGHEKIQTTLGTYGHLYPNTNLEVAKKLTGILQVQSATESIANYTSNQHTAIYHRTVEEK